MCTRIAILYFLIIHLLVINNVYALHAYDEKLLNKSRSNNHRDVET